MIAFIEDLKNYRAYSYPGSSLPVVMLRVAIAHPAFLALALYRFGNWGHRMKVPVLSHLILLVFWILFPFVRLLTGVQILPRTSIAPGLALLHYGPTIIHPNSTIGAGCVIFHCVSLAADVDHSAPTLGDRVQIGTGAVVFGRTKVGDDAMIGAGAVVTKDIPANSIAGGVPAKIIKSQADRIDA